MFAGTWKGQGRVLKRSGEVAATYLETAVWEVSRQTPDFCVYRVHQDTKHAEKSKPMHTETGFVKIMTATGQAVGSVVHPFPSGMLTEHNVGQLEGTTLTLNAMDFHRVVKSSDSSSKEATGLKRVYKLVSDGSEQDSNKKLVYDQYLATGGTDDENFYHHLHCELELQP